MNFRNLGFDIYRQSGNGAAAKLNSRPLVGPTHFRDRDADLSIPTRYIVTPLGDSGAADGSFALPAHPPVRQYLSIPLRTPPGYHANDASVGDLNGDGRYEVVVHMVGEGRDNSQSGLTSEPILHAYRLDGTFLWSINLGKNVREGAHYTPFVIYDLDGDAKAEIVCRTADGTVDGSGVVIGDWREELIARTRDSRELRLYTTTLPTEHRLVTLMHDPTYRMAIAWQNVGYNQPPHPGFFLGHDMPPRRGAGIRIVRPRLDGRRPSAD